MPCIIQLRVKEISGLGAGKDVIPYERILYSVSFKFKTEEGNPGLIPNF